MITPESGEAAEIVARLDRSARHAATPCGDGRMVWRSWGERVPLVLLHGGAGSWRHWIRNIEALSRVYQVWTPDTPGLGSSDLPPDPTNSDGIAAVIGAGLDRLLGPTGRYHLAGFSFGGLLSAALAAQHGERVRSLTLVGSGGMGGRRAIFRLERVRDKTGAEREAAHRANLGILMIADPARIDDLAMAIQAWNSDHTRLNSTGFHAQGPVPRSLARVRVPLNGIWGDRDASAGPYLPDRESVVAQPPAGRRFPNYPGRRPLGGLRSRGPFQPNAVGHVIQVLESFCFFFQKEALPYFPAFGQGM